MRGSRGSSAASVLAVLMGLAAVGCVADAGEAGPGSGRWSSERGALVYSVDISVWSGEVTDAEVDCWWADGVRNAIVGSQDPRIARQQLDMALSRGMSVDGYVYLMWDRDMTRQVEDALALFGEYPIGRLWLDVEQAPAGLGRRALEGKIREAVDACGSFPCGIYTAAWWWNPNGIAGAFADVPLWYANYDRDRDLASWSRQSFGGWAEPWGKQWDGDVRLCGIDVDQNTIYSTAVPDRAHPEPLPAPSGAPGRPSGLYPDDVMVQTYQDARPLWATVPGATRYELEITYWSGSAFRAYYTYPTTTNARRFSPRFRNTSYRFRVRAGNASGWGPWSGEAQFDFGTVSSPPPRPGAPPPLPPPSDPPPSEPPPSDPPPSDPPPSLPPSAEGLSPLDGARLTTSAVTLSRNPVTGATRYEHDIEYDDGAGYRHYYTYSGGAPSRTFYPTYRDTAYRWRVRATTSGGEQPWTAWSTFLYGAGAVAPGVTPPSDPPPSDPPPSDPPPSDPPPSDPPPTTGVPTGLSPSGSTVTASSVTLTCDPYAGASRYELAIEVMTSGGWRTYYTYATSSPSRTFYPATRGTSYRFRVRAQTAGGWTEWSAFATFDVS